MISLRDELGAESESLSIRALNVRAVRVPMDRPHRTSAGVVSESPLILTDLICDDGFVGHSLIFTYSAAALKPTADLIRNMEPLLQGEDSAPTMIERTLAAKFRLLGTQGLVGMAIAAIEMAAWDALARRQGVSLARLLGGFEKPIPAYGPVGHDGPRESASVAAAWAERGLKGIKAKIGYPTLREDLAVVRAIRKAVGDNFAIMVDYNQCLTPTDAIERIRALDGEGLTWIEEPTLAHDHSGHARIARSVKTPIQCGENWWSTLDVRDALAAQACDYLMADVMKIGGISGWLRTAAIARANNAPLSSHLFPEVSAQLMSVTPTSHWLGYADWWNPLLREPLSLQHGNAVIEAKVGSGIEWVEAVVTRYSA